MYNMDHVQYDTMNSGNQALSLLSWATLGLDSGVIVLHNKIGEVSNLAIWQSRNCQIKFCQY